MDKDVGVTKSIADSGAEVGVGRFSTIFMNSLNSPLIALHTSAVDCPVEDALLAFTGTGRSRDFHSKEVNE